VSLASQPPRRYPARRVPRYPSLLAGALVASACTPTSSPRPIAVPTPPPTFAVDASNAFPAVTCRGECPSPFEQAAHEKDGAQIQARADWCVREGARSGEPITSARSTLRADVDASGHAIGARFDPPGWIREDIAACVLRLVDTAKLTPPEDGESRRELWTTVTVEPK
jgi:hypothetical protein